MFLIALTLVWELIALVFFSFWSCISQSPASPRPMSKSSLPLLPSLASLLFILLLTFLLTLKAEVNTWKERWPFNENVSIPVVGGERRALCSETERSLHDTWAFTNSTTWSLTAFKCLFSFSFLLWRQGEAFFHYFLLFFVFNGFWAVVAIRMIISYISFLFISTANKSERRANRTTHIFVQISSRCFALKPRQL